MAIKQNNAKNRRLPYLEPFTPGSRPPRWYDPEHLCKVSTYLEISAAAGVEISLQALYARCRAGTIPCVYIDGIPLIVCTRPVRYLLDQHTYITEVVNNLPPDAYPHTARPDLIQQAKDNPNMLICMTGRTFEPSIP